ncbi:M23 family metallopeptidase [Cognatishimia activa]|uniref:M23 family metallopeptidase n=1 Tax=Cognatishimia activa TaxID=1715691 RepID=UPI001FD82429|nr:M23 family metallopeptidase [Cognatishimia activa]
MRGIASKIHVLLEKWFPERRLFLRSDTDTRFIRLKPHTQLMIAGCGALVVGWAIIVTAVLFMDSIGSGNFREQAKRDQENYQLRLNTLSDERDQRSAEALAAQERFTAALEQISLMQSELLSAETRSRELETGIEVIQSTLRRTMKERDEARTELERVTADADAYVESTVAQDLNTEGVESIVTALAETAAERDELFVQAREAVAIADNMELELKLLEEMNDQIFTQLEDAMTVSVEPLEKMFASAGLSTDALLEEVKRGYTGLGGPNLPLTVTTSGGELSPEMKRANALLGQLDRLNMYRIAAETTPFAVPYKTAVRYTSGFGMRWGRMHRGADIAGPHGTDIFATADGVVIHAGWSSGYGKLIKIKHAHGIETRYAHLAKFRVKKGDRVSRGQHIGDMGNTGRSTGTHLHYEVRINGRAVNPMKFIKAARDVF